MGLQEIFLLVVYLPFFFFAKIARDDVDVEKLWSLNPLISRKRIHSMELSSRPPLNVSSVTAVDFPFVEVTVAFRFSPMYSRRFFRVPPLPIGNPKRGRARIAKSPGLLLTSKKNFFPLSRTAKGIA